MSDLRTIALEDGLEMLIDYRGKSPPKSPVGIPVISAKVVKAGRVTHPIEQKIATSYYPIWMTRGLPQPGDVVLTTEGPLGEVAQLGEETAGYALGQRIVCLRGKRGVVDGTFLKFLLMSPTQQSILAGFATGTTVAGISQKALRTVPITIPTYDEQVAIGGLLSALDDKIDLNRRMNETLEAMARAIFKDWFVDFGPTRAKMEGRPPYLAPDLWALFPDRLDDEGKPEGWNTTTVEAVAERVGMGPFGSNIKVETFVDDGVPIISGQHLNGTLLEDNTYRFITEAHAARMANSKVRRGDIVFTHAGNIGQVSIIPESSRYEEYILSQRQFYLRCKERISPEFLVYFFRSPEGQHKLLANASQVGVPSIARPATNLKAIELCLPDFRALDAFTSAIHSLHRKLGANRQESETLVSLRDMLLPKLMSGEVRVREAESLLGAVA